MATNKVFQELNQASKQQPLILPSMLLCDFSNLKEECQRLEKAGFKALHLDVMDGVFVPNISYGMTIVKAFRQATDLPLDVHLMIQNPIQYVDGFREAGADIITFHAEADGDNRQTLEKIHQSGAAAGIVLNPPTAAEQLQPVIDLCDMVLVMSVHAGFGGQSFIPDVLSKFDQITQLPNCPADIAFEIDGGINKDSINQSHSAGANWLVVGSGVFKHEDYTQAHQDLLALV